MSNHCNNLCSLYHVTKSLNGNNILKLLRQGFKRCGKCLKWIQVFTRIHCPCCGKTLSMRMRSRGSSVRKTIAMLVARERNRRVCAKYRKTHPDIVNRIAADYRSRHPEAIEKSKKMWIDNKDKYNANRRAKYAEMKALKQIINEIPIAPLITVR